MEQTFARLDRFISSPHCIFQFKPIDYPSQLQQHLISSYFTMTDLLRTQSSDDTAKLLNTSEKYLEVFIPGLLYEMILSPQSAEQHFETYMPSLRSESWNNFSKLLQHLLKDSFLWIKAELRTGIIPLLSKLKFYSQL